MDTTILIDILKDEFRDFQQKLYTALESREELVIPAPVYAELMPQFKGDTKLLGIFLDDHKIQVEPLDIESVTKGAHSWMNYLKQKTKVTCPHCGHKQNSKEHFLSDFYIGGFALAKCKTILTRDRGIYKKYFPELPGYKGCLQD